MVHTAVIQNNHMVCPGHSTHPVGDDQYRLSGEKLRERPLYLGLILHVHRGGGCVQQYDGRVLEQRTGDGDALSLAAG